MTNSWERSAICRGTDPDLWFSDNPADQWDALRICGNCPVIAACLDNALANEGGINTKGRYGIVGGRTPVGRYSEYKRRLTTTGIGTRAAGHGGVRHRAACGTAAAQRRHKRYGEVCDRCNTPRPAPQPTADNARRARRAA